MVQNGSKSFNKKILTKPWQLSLRIINIATSNPNAAQ